MSQIFVVIQDDYQDIFLYRLFQAFSEFKLVIRGHLSARSEGQDITVLDLQALKNGETTYCGDIAF